MPHQPFAATIPDDRLYDPAHDMWVAIDDDVATIGITAFGIFLAGEIVAFTAKPRGASVARGRGLGTVESAKTVHALHAPLALTLAEINEALEERPGPLNRDPHRHWLIRGPLSAPADRAGLVDAAAYRRHIRSIEPDAVLE